MRTIKTIISKLKGMGLMRPMGPMGLMGLMRPMRPMGLIALMALAGCSDDDRPGQPQQHELSFVTSVSAPDFKTEQEENTTRSWTPPSSPTTYYLYDDLYSGIYANYQSLNNRTIDVFFTHVEAITNPTPSPLHCRLRYNSSANLWKMALPNPITEEEVEGGNYYVYGFIPRDAADGASIAPYPSYDEGAVLTIQGMKTATADACVIIGAKEGPDANTDNGLQAGDFMFRLNTTVPAEKPTNYMYLLFDHLGAALSISMKVHNEYQRLRTIKVKELHLQTVNDEGTMKAKMNITITLASNTTGSNPIQSVVYEPVGDDLVDGIIFQSTDGLGLSTTPTLFMGHFIPHGVTKLVLTTVYDVYDKKGNLIRLNCRSRNTLQLSELLTGLVTTLRGRRYTINMTIQPTYLYMLSEPDLNNPEVNVE